MPAKRLSDGEAKGVLRNWPQYPRERLMPDGPWLRAQPPDGHTTGPRLIRPGSAEFTARTQPDGLWISLTRSPGSDVPDAAAIFVVEVSRTTQNFFDKRSRYAAGHAALILSLEKAWLLHEIERQNNAKWPRWELTEQFDTAPTRSFMLPVRSVRVLFAMPNDSTAGYNRLRGAVALESHEYLAPHSALSHTNPRLRKLVRGMLIAHAL